MGRTRAIAGWLPALVLVPAAVVAGVTATVPDDDLAAMREEQPLDVGTTWVYDVLDHGEPSGTRTSQVVGQAQLLGPEGGLLPAAELTRRYTDYPGSGPRSFTSYLAVDGRSMLQYAQEEADRWYQLDPPAVAYQLPVEEGHAWSYDGMVGDSPFSYDTELTEIVDVEASGHTFEGCAHYVNTIHLALDDDPDNDPDATELLEEWTCPGIGTVRSRDRLEATGLDYTEELTEFHGVDANWYAEGHRPAPVTAGAAPGATAGFGPERSYGVPDGTLSRDLAWTDVRTVQTLTPPVSDSEVMAYAEQDGRVTLRTTDTGEMRWRVQLRGPVLAAPVVAGDVVVVADSRKQVWALSVADGTARWVQELPDVVSASPLAFGDLVAVPGDDGSLTAFGLADGEQAWQVSLGGPAHAAPAYDGEHVLVADDSGAVTALDPEDGSVAWSDSFDSGPGEGPVVVDGKVLAQDRDGVVHAWAGDGDVAWQTRGHGVPTAPMAAGNGVVVTTAGQRDVAAYATSDGRRLWGETLPKLRSAPAVVGDQVVLVTVDGEVEVLGLRTGRREDHWALPLPTADSDWSVDADLALVDGALVITAAAGGHLADEVLFAYPVTTGVPPGLSLRAVERALPGVPAERPVLAGDQLVTPTTDGLYRVDADGTATRLIGSDDAIQTGAAVADGVVVARHGQELQGRRLADGKKLWSAAGGGDPAFGTIPAADDRTVAYAVGDAGLAALDLHTGTPRWVQPVPDQVLAVSPILLPDGDVVYGGGGLARYDGATGDVAWRLPEAHTFGPAAYADGVVYATTASPTAGTGALVAVDAGSGDILWSQPVSDPPLHLGPAVADGVVVAFDGHTAHAYDATAGTELWSLTAERQPGGPPYVADGRVWLTEYGSGRDVGDRDYRVTVHDLATGRLLAAYEPNGMPYAPQPAVTGTSDGRLLLPISAGLTVLEAR